jgi:shikimate dehydrogenase
VPNLAVIGHPVAHSRSPAMQTAALTALGLAGEWSYGAIDWEPEQFEAEVAGLAAEGEYRGVNVTIPHKEAALDLADEVDPVAREIGAANTLVFADDVISAFNTDAAGLRNALKVNPNGRRALVLGAGGAARAAIWALGDAGAVVDIWNRTESRAAGVVEQMAVPQARVVTDPDTRDYGLIVNTTSVGLHGEDPFQELPLDPEHLTGEMVVVDMVYAEGPSTLSQVAAHRGAMIRDGLEILVQQGALSLAIWLGMPKLDEGVIEAMRAAAYGDTPPIA